MALQAPAGNVEDILLSMMVFHPLPIVAGVAVHGGVVP